MTEIEAQKFIARHTPPRHRCVATEAKISLIRSQFVARLFTGATLIVVSLIGIGAGPNAELWVRIFGLTSGVVVVGFSLLMIRRLREVCRLLYSTQS